jgi:uncharacterized protein
VILTGIHLMQTGAVEANLLRLNEEFKLPFLAELIERKVRGPEKGSLDSAERTLHQTEYERLISKLEEAAAKSDLPDEPVSRDPLNDLLVRVRLGSIAGRGT